MPLSLWCILLQQSELTKTEWKVKKVMEILEDLTEKMMFKHTLEVQGVSHYLWAEYSLHRESQCEGLERKDACLDPRAAEGQSDWNSESKHKIVNKWVQRDK